MSYLQPHSSQRCRNSLRSEPMHETHPVDEYTQFNSVNGGISMWIPKLADKLVGLGVEKLLEELRKEVFQRNTDNMQNDFHYLVRGLESIDRSTLDNAITPLKTPYQEIEELSKTYEELKTSLGDTDHKWLALSERVKQELERWEDWAIKTEMARQQELLPWTGDQYGMEHKLRFDLKASSSIQSKPHKDIEFFKKQIDAINRIISRAYITNSLPNNLSVIDFHNAIAELLKEQEEFNKTTSNKAKITERWQKARDEYRAKCSDLLKLLWNMPEESHWALFRISAATLSDANGQ